MSKKPAIFILAFAFLVAGALTTIVLNNKKVTSPPMNAESSTVNSQAEVMASTEEMEEAADIQTGPMPSSSAAVAGSYQDYDEMALATATGKRILFFHAPWCSQCRSLEAGISAQTLPHNVAIFKVDYDSRQDLRQKYGVTLQTTFLVLNEKNEVVKKHVAYNEPDFEAVKKAIL